MRARGAGAAAQSALPRQLGEYRLLRAIGRGAMGQVYLAEDTVLDRLVAVKLIAQRRPDEAARRSFIAEARAIARLSHPNVVTVHRAGEIEGTPYLVTELIRGRSLAEVPKPTAPERVLEIGLGLARGLAAAHRSGVLHRDIKPANVMLTDEGGVKILDFGLAKIADPDGAARRADPRAPLEEGGARISRSGERSAEGEIVGTPLYMAPEVLAGAPASRRSDVYAAGAVLFELCAGVAPRDTLAADAELEAWIAADVGELRSHAGGIDPRFAAVVDRCLARDPQDRFASADALGDALAAIGEGDRSQGILPEGNPYRGLTAFELEHRALFFGREAESSAVLDRLRADGIVVVTGDSGVGKSSLCRAGVLALAAEGALGDGRRTTTIAVVPGQRPMRALVTALAASLGIAEEALFAEAQDDPGAPARAARLALGRDRGLVLLVDQLEELCTLARPEEAAVFCEALAALPSPLAGMRLLLAVRGDFFTRIAALPALAEAATRSLYLLRPLSREGVRAAITGPLSRKGISFSPPELIDTLAAAANTSGGLPLLQFALAELWEARGGANEITPSALEAIGGVEGALARHADQVISLLSAEARAAARRVLLRLLTVDKTRARRTEEELEGRDPAARAAIEALVRGRLLVACGEAGYEIAHEALIHAWGTLGRWIDETHEQKLLVQEIDQAADLWARRGRPREETWTGEALAQAAHRVQAGGLALAPLAREFLDAGIARRDADQRRRRRLFGAIVLALAALAFASTAAAVAFRNKEREALRQQAQIRLAAADLGELDLILEPFDWDPAGQRAVPAKVPVGLDFRLHTVSAEDAQRPGRLYGDDDLKRTSRRVEATSLHLRIEARSGQAYLEVTGRGEGCGSSYLYLRRLPGYTDRVAGSVPVWHIPVPTCEATRAEMVEIPAGEFLRNLDAPGDTPGTLDENANLPAFLIDRTEVTRGAFSIYGGLESLTGDGAARTSYLNLDRPGGERLPIVGINALTAASYCRFLGKELPSVEEWQKALRGGFLLGDGAPNPAPKRLTPWVKAKSQHPSNVDGDEDGAPDLAPVGSYPEDVSPYGVMDMGGNVGEWSRTPVEAPRMRGLRYVNGTSWVTPPARRGIEWRNVKPERYLDFTIGIRCMQRITDRPAGAGDRGAR